MDVIDKYAPFFKDAKGHRSTTLNFTRLSMSSLPRRTAGQKGGKPRRQFIVVVQFTLTRHSVDSNAISTSANSQYPPSLPGPSNPQSLTVITSSGNWNWNWDSVPSSYMGITTTFALSSLSRIFSLHGQYQQKPPYAQSYQYPN